MFTPQLVKDTKNQLVALVSYLIEIGLVVDQNFPTVKQSVGKIWDISFSEAINLSLCYSDISYEEIYNELASRRCFSVKFLDGGLLQILFRYNNNTLIKHRLAYYPSPYLCSFSEDPEVYEVDSLFTDITTRKIIPFPIRFDFDTQNGIDVEHPICHLTFGDIQNCRLPVSAALSPKWFIEFILRCFYLIKDRDFLSNLPKATSIMNETITANEKNLIHLYIPYK